MLDGVLTIIVEKTEPGDKIFCVNGINTVYYLTETRPVTKDPWTFRLATYESFKEELYSITQQELPKIVIIGKKPITANTPSIPWHPGALKYFEEIGMEIPTHVLEENFTF